MGFDKFREVFLEFSEASVEKMNKVLSTIITPDDGRKWPKTWLQSDKRVRDVLSERDEDYWSALAEVKLEDVDLLVEEWGKVLRLPLARRIRLFGSAVKPVGISTGSRFYWDMVVICYYLQGRDMIESMQLSLGYGKLDVLYPKWVWKWLRNNVQDTVIPDITDVNLGVEVLVDG